MIKLLKNANVYAPEKLGKKDILIEGEKILLLQDSIEGYEGLPGVETYDLEGKIVVPAYIDMHVHITGGGGEQGPASRVTGVSAQRIFKKRYYHRGWPSGYRWRNPQCRESGSKGPCPDRGRHDRVYTDQLLRLPADHPDRKRRARYHPGSAYDRCEGSCI